jgi:hypothetical protein
MTDTMTVAVDTSAVAKRKDPAPKPADGADAELVGRLVEQARAASPAPAPRPGDAEARRTARVDRRASTSGARRRSGGAQCVGWGQVSGRTVPTQLRGGP